MAAPQRPFTLQSRRALSNLGEDLKNPRFKTFFYLAVACILLLTLSLIAGLAAAVLAPLATVTQHSDVQGKCVDRDTDCGFVGNPDIYGLGIRLGMYLQWVSLWIAFTFLPGEKPGLRLTNHIFGFAMFVALFILTFRGDCMYVAEVVCILFIFYGGVASMWNFSHMHRRPSGKLAPGGETFHLYANIVIWYMISAPMMLFSAWFWIDLARGREFHFATTPCGTSFFLFGRIGPHSFLAACRFLAFLSLWAISSNVITSLPLLEYVLKPSTLSFVKMFTTEGVMFIFYFLVVKSLECLGHDESRVIDLLDSVLHAVALIWTIVGIELTLWWNSVSEVYVVDSTGQLIPLIIGTASLVPIVYEICLAAFPKVEKILKKIWRMMVEDKAWEERRENDGVHVSVSFQLSNSKWASFGTSAV